MRKIVPFAMAVLLSGCANINYIMDNYSGVELKEVATQYDTFRVFDKPTENRLMITSSIASSVGQGVVGGALFNPAIAASPEPVFHEAVELYLAQSGRKCEVQPGVLLAQPQWEFRYSCDPQQVASK